MWFLPHVQLGASTMLCTHFSLSSTVPRSCALMAPRPCGVLLEEFYPALLVCMVDDLLGEGARECEDLEPALHSVASSHSEARTLVLQYMHECISTDSIDAARFQKPIPLYKAAAVEAAAAAADLTPDTLDEAPLCLYLIEETRRLAAIARASLIDITRWAAVLGEEGEVLWRGCLSVWGSCYPPCVCRAQRWVLGRCHYCKCHIVATFGLADVLCASPSPPTSVFCLYSRSLLPLY
jgi:hypothetical protein